MKFPYVKTPANDSIRPWISRPIIPVMLIGPNGTVVVDALIDSGADKSMFHKDIGKEIGIDFTQSEQETFSGVEGGRSICYTCDIQLQIIGLNEKIKISAGFADTSGVFAILGQADFFDSYKIKFEKDHNTIEIISVKKK